MAHVLIHASAIDDLAADRGSLPREVETALERHLAYARFGALLPDLPQFTGFVGQAAGRILGRPPVHSPFSTLFHNGAPVTLGLRMCELISKVSFVGKEPGLAIMAGYFSHLAVDRSLRAPIHDLVRRARVVREHPGVTLRRIESIQALFHMRRRVGRDVAGWPGIVEHLRVLKRRGYPFRGVGGGLYMLVHRTCLDTLGPAPKKSDLDQWVKGIYLYARFLGSPAGTILGLPEDSLGLRPMLYQGADIDFEKLYRAATERARHHVQLAYQYLVEGDFSRDAREHFLTELPEGSIS